MDNLPARRVFTAYSVSRELAINVLILGQKSSKDSQIFQKLSPCPFHTKPHPLASMCRTCRCRRTPGHQAYATPELANG